jgi:hypothetical protein
VCGGCGTRCEGDWATPFLNSLPSRAAAAAVVAAAAPRTVAVRAAPSGWVVRRPTGAQVVVGTLSALVRALGPDAAADVALPAVPTVQLPEPDRRRPVVVVHGAAAAAVDAESDGWAERLMTYRDGTIAVAAPRRPQEVLAAMLDDPLRHHVRVVGLQSATLPGWRSPSLALPGLPATVDPGQAPAVVALVGVRACDRPPGERTSTQVDVGGRRLVVETWGRTVLSADVTREPAPEATNAGAMSRTHVRIVR